jgi:hypothetical protein
MFFCLLYGVALAAIVWAQPTEPENLDGLILQIDYWNDVIESLRADEQSEYVIGCYDNIQSYFQLILIYIESAQTLKEYGDPEW